MANINDTFFCVPVAYDCFARLLHMRPPGFHGVR